MKNLELENKRNLQVKELYEAFGRFAVEFELMVHFIKFCIIFSLDRIGLKNQKAVRILLYKTSTRNLIFKLKGLTILIYNNNEAINKRLLSLYNYTGKIIDQRNNIIHSTWFVEYFSKNQTDFNIAKGFKEARHGLDFNHSKYSKEDFSSLTQKIIYARELYHLLNECISFDEDIITNISIERINKIK